MKLTYLGLNLRFDTCVAYLPLIIFLVGENLLVGGGETVVVTS
jgi:hypothetical protein